MKLLRCHIENFGVLSNFDFDFSSGLTVIYRENGFGKSTFAAFIKAMFYGMPRGGSRSVVENERKRYDPWQGGKYGGFLEFEYQETRYRVTRYFGKTASKDTFQIMDISNRQNITPFSERLGEELFQLDAESFSRSTYMPQLSAHDLKATTSIRTKLSNLVDNTNDLNNFDTATESLRQFRTKFRAYRGSSGVINDLETKYNTLEHQKYEAEKEKPRLQGVSEEIERLSFEKETNTAVVSDLREKIRVASAQKSLQLLQDQLADLSTTVDLQKQSLSELDDSYPAGYPTLEEIKIQRDNLSISQQASQRLEKLTLPEADRITVEKGKILFSDIDKASQDIDTCNQLCNELTEVSAKLTSQMFPEELQRLEELSKKFEESVPSKEELQIYLNAADKMNAAQIQLSSLAMSDESQRRLEKLKELFGSEIPDDNTLTACEQSQHNRDVLLLRKKSCTLSDKDQQDYQYLQRTFASGIPSEQEILDRQSDFRRIIELTSKKNTKTTRIEDDITSHMTTSKVPHLCGGIGVMLLVFGIICFVANLTTPGILLLVAGFVGLLVAFWTHTHQMVSNRAKSTSVVTASAITDAENQELYDLNRILNDFLLRFYPDAADPENKLIQLLLSTKKFVDLNDKKISLDTEQQQIGEDIAKNTQYLREVFDQYYHGEPYRDTFVQELRDSLHNYEMLEIQMTSITRERENLSEKIENCRTQIIHFLRRYYPVELPRDLRQGVHTLASEVESFSELSHKSQTIMSDNAEYQVREAELTDQIQKILTKYDAFDSQRSFTQCLQELRRRLEEYKVSSERKEHFTHDHVDASKQKQMAEESIHQFLQKYQLSGDTPANLIDSADNDTRRRQIIEASLREETEKLNDFLVKNPGIEQQRINAEELPDLDALQNSEKETQEKIDAIDRSLRDLRQEQDSLRQVVETIPILDDQMEYLKIKLQSAEKKCELIDRTIELLNKAKDNLANSYVGKVERGFEMYAHSLLDGQLGHVMVDKDLNLYIDEKGAAREVGSFSTGMIDGIMLCMRLSLVDALFTTETPFLILDDPFVNLDDDHTRKALEILKKISLDHQVVYLVCNSSRS